MKLTEDDKKLLTEFLFGKGSWITSPYKVTHCRTCSCGAYNRDFTTWQDLGNLKNKLVEKGMWTTFVKHCERSARVKPLSQEELNSVNFKTICPIIGREYAQLYDWLLNPDVFIPLVVEFLRKE